MGEKKKKLNIKRVSVILLILFLVIVTVLTASSTYLNNKATSATKTVVPYSNSVIVTASDQKTLKKVAGAENTKYTQIDDNTFVVNYKSAKQAQNAVKTLNDAGYSDAISDTCFVISGASKKIDLPDDYNATKVPEGMTLREYADSVGKKIVAVIDTGVDSKYTTASKNFSSSKDDDTNGHGTLIAQEILQYSDDKAIILSIKAIEDNGVGYMSNVMQAVQYAREQGADIINMSIITDAVDDNNPFKSLIESTIADGITVVAAAGNQQSNANSYYPAGIDGVISVGAMDDEKTKTVYSNYNADYYEEADSTSEASAILTGILASGNELNEEISDKQVTVKDEDKAKEDQKIISINKDGEFEVQSASQIVYITFNHERSGAIHLAKNGGGYEYPETSYSFNLGAFAVRTGVQIGAINSFEGYVCENLEISNSIEVNGWSVKDGKWTNSEIQGHSEKGLNGAIMVIPNTASPYTTIKLNTRLATVNVALWGGSSSTVSEGIHTSGGRYSSLNLGTPTRNGFKFLRWKMLSGGGSIRDTLYIYGTSDGSIAAEWGANVMLDPNGGTLSASDSNIYKQSDGSYMINPRNKTDDFSDLNVSATRNGYKFKGFYTSATGGTQVFKPTGNKCAATKDGTYYNTENQWIYDAPTRLYAQWEPLERTVTYKPNGGQGSDRNQIVLYGTNWSTWGSDTFSKTGYTLSSWNTKSDGTGTTYSLATEQGNYNVDGTTTLYAQWTANTYNITYKGNGGTWNNTDSWGEKATYDTNYITQSNFFTRTGYVFTGWKEANGTDWTNYIGNDWKWTYTNDVTLYAQWRPITYTINFDSNSDRHVRYNNATKADVSEAASTEVNQYASASSAMSSQDFKYDESKNLSSNKYKWAGHTFLGWSTNKYATKADYTNSVSIKNLTATDKGKITFYAIWKADNHKVTVDPVKGSGKWDGVAGTTNGTDATHNDGAGNTKWGDKVILGNATPDNKSATINYDTQADDAVIDRTSETVRWVFNKWTNTGNGILYNNSPRDNDGNHDGGNECYYIIQDTNDTVTANYYFQTVVLPSPTRDGYTFLGWYYDANCTKKAASDGKGNAGDRFRTTENVTLYARWQKNSYNYADEEQVYIQNKKDTTADVYIRKIDATTGVTLTESQGEGFVLEIYKNSVSSSNLVLKIDTKNGVYNASGKKVMNASDRDTNGWYRVTDYISKNQKYVVHESSAPAGYTIAVDQTFTFNGKDRVQISVKDEEITTENPHDEYTMKVDKYNRPIANATFQLKDETTGKVVKEFTTNENGAFPIELDKKGKPTVTMFNYCIIGHRYSLTETKAPEGFNLADTVYFDAKLNEKNQISPVTVLEKVKTVGSLKIKKVDHDDNPLEGATFQLFMKNSDGELVPCYMDPNTKEWIDSDKESDNAVLMTATSGENGIAEFKNLPLRANFTGSEPDFTKSYYLKEIHAPQGYNLITDIFEIRLSENNVNGNETYTVKDDTVTLTLEAGGNGNKYYNLIGSAFILIALGLTIKKKYIF